MNMIAAVLYREFKIRTSSMMWLFYDLFVPIVYLLLFGIGFDRAMVHGIVAGGATISYNAFFLAGVLSMAGFGIAINTSYGLFVDRDNGIFYEFLTYPMTRQEFLVGKIVFNSLVSAVQAGLTIGLGAAFLGIPVRWELLPLAFAAVILGTAGWYFFLTVFALRIRRNDTFNTLLNVVYFVFMFSSSLFYPLDGLPAWLRGIAMANPLTWHTDVIRYLTIGLGVASSIALEALGFCLFLGASFTLAVRTLHDDIVK
jgi:ABC-2 type transport system permease protein